MTLYCFFLLQPFNINEYNIMKTLLQQERWNDASIGFVREM